MLGQSTTSDYIDDLNPLAETFDPPPSDELRELVSAGGNPFIKIVLNTTEQTAHITHVGLLPEEVAPALRDIADQLDRPAPEEPPDTP